MEQKMLETLEYDKILNKLSHHCATSLGKERALATQPANELTIVKDRLAITDQAMQVIRLKGHAPFGGITNPTAAIKRAAIGSMLSPHELLDIANTVYGARRLKQFLRTIHEEDPIPLLYNHCIRIESHRPLEDRIRKCIGDQAELHDHASPALARIRAQIRTSESRIRERLEQMIRSSSVQKKLQETLITMKNDRYVLPVKAEYRSHFGGIVHDQSSSGATMFIEPESIVLLNNQIKQFQSDERHEIEKILRELSLLIQENTDSLLQNIEAVTELDYVFGRAGLAEAWQATLPKVNDRGISNLKQARHPLIPAEDVVPIDVQLGEPYSVMMITGPNTGGKTVTLKTVGLLHLMAASGLFIPAEDGSEVNVFDAVYADIGDEQSIEQNLSTFSSHMTNIIHILKRMTPHSLVLLDELGAGTDPAEGSALAISILEHIRKMGCRLIATTHYSELKAYAYNQEGVINASMEFNVETLSPTYRLLVGIPGRSNAFAIAARLGLNSEIIDEAKGRVGEQDRNVESMIAQLESSREAAEQDRKEAAQLRNEMQQLRAKLTSEQKRFEQQRQKLWEQAKDEAQAALARAKAEAEEIITQLRETAREEQASIKDHKLIDSRRRLQQAGLETPEYTDLPVLNEERQRKPANVEAGDEVHVRSLRQTGHVVEVINEKEVMVQLGIMRVTVEKSDLEKKKEPQNKQTVVQPKTTSVKRATGQQIRTELDLRGKMLEDALYEVDRFLDESILNNLNQVYIIHGKGTGVLRSGVQDYLKNHQQVSQFRLGNPGEGGSGITVVKFR